MGRKGRSDGKEKGSSLAESGASVFPSSGSVPEDRNVGGAACLEV